MHYYVVDAFADALFHGNPAGVCVLDGPVEAGLMQQIAAENRLSETAFLQRERDGYALRWFTPGFEIDLCGHATLASAFVVCRFLEPGAAQVRFSTMSGILTVRREGARYVMDFPSRPPEEITLTSEWIACLGVCPQALYASRDLMAVLESEDDVRRYTPDYTKLKGIAPYLGLILTAPGKGADFVSRYFCPELDLEDPVTGSSHCTLAPYWARRLGKREMVAQQISKRGGALSVGLDGERVKIGGEAVLYLQGEIHTDMEVGNSRPLGRGADRAP